MPAKCLCTLSTLCSRCVQTPKVSLRTLEMPCRRKQRNIILHYLALAATMDRLSRGKRRFKFPLGIEQYRICLLGQHLARSVVSTLLEKTTRQKGNAAMARGNAIVEYRIRISRI